MDDTWTKKNPVLKEEVFKAILAADPKKLEKILEALALIHRILQPDDPGRGAASVLADLDFDISDYPPLHLACANMSADARILPARERFHRLPLSRMIRPEDCHAVIRILAGCGADPDRRDREGRTGLMVFLDQMLDGRLRDLCSADDPDPESPRTEKLESETAGILLSRTKDLSLTDDRGRSVLHYAAEKGEPCLVGGLLAAGADPLLEDGKKETPLEAAALRGRRETFKLIKNKVLERGAVIPVQRLFLLSCSAGLTDEAARYAAEGVDINTSDGLGRTGLMLAAANSHRACVDFLLSQPGLLVNAVDKENKTALRWALDLPIDDELIVRLLDAGSNPDIRDSKASTSFLEAVYCSVPVLRAFLEKGADIRSTDGKGRTALMLAANGGPPDDGMPGHVELLLKAGCGVNALDAGGRTALHWACLNSAVKVVELLVDAGAALDLRDDKGTTVLMVAARFGYLAIAELLLDRGADPRLTDSRGRCAADHAAESGNQEMMELFSRLI